ncbi:hypothetical protein ACFL5O_09950, partial [Myxococcota bacterium]
MTPPRAPNGSRSRKQRRALRQPLGDTARDATRRSASAKLPGPSPLSPPPSENPAHRAADPLPPHGFKPSPFTQGFPDDPQLAPLVDAFERGDYALVRRDAERLARNAADPAVREAASDLRRRLDPDPLAKLVLGVAFGLLL